MEEDIKILEDFIKACNEELLNARGDILKILTLIPYKSMTILIQAYKEQEQVIDEIAYDIFTVFKPQLVLKYGIENVKEFKEMFINKVKENKE